MPGPAPKGNPHPVRLDPVGRGIADLTYDNFAVAIAVYEAGPEVSRNIDLTVGDLGLSNKEEGRIVDFLKTLTDGYRA